jgi:hypothetical protein
MNNEAVRQDYKFRSFESAVALPIVNEALFPRKLAKASGYPKVDRCSSP